MSKKLHNLTVFTANPKNFIHWAKELILEFPLKIFKFKPPI